MLPNKFPISFIPNKLNFKYLSFQTGLIIDIYSDLTRILWKAKIECVIVLADNYY